MIPSIIWFAAIFLVVFPPAFALIRTIPEKRKADKYRRFLEEGERRRKEAADMEAWKANQEVDLK
jgi:hypothetical protein